MTKIVGLTGGIGSGKTTVAKMFEELGVPIYIADIEARKITNKSTTLDLIKAAFGSSVIENGILNRESLAKIVFSNPEKLSKLSEIIHPLVAQDFKKWLIINKEHHYVIKEAAILLETEKPHNCDYVITVTAPIDIRIQRVIDRDRILISEVQNRINNQWSDEKRIEKSDFVIVNVDFEQTYEQVNVIHQKIINSLK
jgi:dephospho-CoA kinase